MLGKPRHQRSFFKIPKASNGVSKNIDFAFAMRQNWMNPLMEATMHERLQTLLQIQRIAEPTDFCAE